MLREIEERGNASTADLVAATGLHENTVRAHLERLRADGHIRAVLDPPAGRGRPARRWHAVPRETADAYAGLAVALAETLSRTGPRASARARQAGVAWGAQLARGRGGDPRAKVLELMREQGFEPEERGGAVDLHRCPLLAAAVSNRDVVCAVHEGMVEGIARDGDADARATLQPFAAPGICILRLQAAT